MNIKKKPSLSKINNTLNPTIKVIQYFVNFRQ